MLSLDEVGSARDLLERSRYGRAPGVEAILRFAEAHKLMADDLVFLLASILEVNDNLVRDLLGAIDKTEETVRRGNEHAVQLSRLANQLTQQLVAQVEAATNRAAGQLNLAADRLAAALRLAETMSGLLIRNAKAAEESHAALRALLKTPPDADPVASITTLARKEAREHVRDVAWSMLTKVREEHDAAMRRRGAVRWLVAGLCLVAILGWRAMR